MRKLIVVSFLFSIWGFIACDSGTRLKAVEPNFGNIAGNDDVTILGNGFKTGMVVYFGKREAQNVIIDSPMRIRVKTPAGIEGKVDVSITRDDGKTFVLRDGFIYRRDAPSGK